MFVGSGTYLRARRAGQRVQLSWLLVWARQAQVRALFWVAAQQGAAGCTLSCFCPFEGSTLKLAPALGAWGQASPDNLL